MWGNLMSEDFSFLATWTQTLPLKTLSKSFFAAFFSSANLSAKLFCISVNAWQILFDSTLVIARTHSATFHIISFATVDPIKLWIYLDAFETPAAEQTSESDGHRKND